MREFEPGSTDLKSDALPPELLLSNFERAKILVFKSNAIFYHYFAEESIKFNFLRGPSMKNFKNDRNGIVITCVNTRKLNFACTLHFGL